MNVTHTNILPDIGAAYRFNQSIDRQRQTVVLNLKIN